MSSDKNQQKSPDTTLMSLDQLSDTIEVMTGVVQRLKRHLDLQLTLSENKPEASALSQELLENERELLDLQQLANEQKLSVAVPSGDNDRQSAKQTQESKEERSFIIEIAQQEEADDLSSDRVLH
tara:strand:+ start:1141 stop:1515 length:375 start_codon:yes stop_codon:yes gene_type:complete